MNTNTPRLPIPAMNPRPTPTPMGCRWCDVDERDHCNRWRKPVGWHKWVQPTQAQIKARMIARRQARKKQE